MTIKKDYDDLEKLEQAYMSCWGITDDIKKISLYIYSLRLYIYEERIWC